MRRKDRQMSNLVSFPHTHYETLMLLVVLGDMFTTYVITLTHPTSWKCFSSRLQERQC